MGVLPCDKTEDEVWRLTADKRNAKKRKKRAERIARIRAMSRPPRQVAVYEAIERLSQRTGCNLPITVCDIVDSIRKAQPSVWRSHFPLNGDNAQRVIRRDLDQMQRDDLVRTWRGKRGILHISFGDNGCVTAVPLAGVSGSALKPWEAEGISRATWYRRRRGTDPDTRTTVVSPDFAPETLDASMFSACEGRETGVAVRKDEVPCGEAVQNITKNRATEKVENDSEANTTRKVA